MLNNVKKFFFNILDYFSAVKNLLTDYEDAEYLLQVPDLIDTIYRNVDLNPRLSAFLLAATIPKYRDQLMPKGEKCLMYADKTKEYVVLRTLSILKYSDDPLVLALGFC